MTYHCGIGPGMSRLGVAPREPHFVCDFCGAIHGCLTRDGLPYAWMRKMHGIPLKWRHAPYSRHKCGKCAAQHPEKVKL